jgi:hypothetical protein
MVALVEKNNSGGPSIMHLTGWSKQDGVMGRVLSALSNGLHCLFC